MKISRNGVAIGAAVVLLAGAAWLPAIGQDAPESILPPGFGETVQPAPRPSATATLPPPGTGGVPLTDSGAATPTPTPTPTDTPTPIDLAAYELPDYARRSLGMVGVVGADGGGLAGPAFGAGDGRAIETLMRRLDVPLPSRWLSIGLRRALVSQVDTPGGVNGADFAAERVWLLLRMGEADAARAVAQSVDVENYTPKLFQVAMQAMLANGDPAGLCPLVAPAMQVSAELGWDFARAMCAALGGKPGESKTLLAAARRRTGRSIDSLLAEKVVGAAAGGAVTIEWAGVDRLTAWRYGLATATAVDIPDELLAGARPQVMSWQATAPMLEAPRRAAASDIAASQGVLSSAALVDLYGEIEAADDSNSAAGATARDLRAAYADGSQNDRLRMLRQLWSEPKTPRARFARLVLTARAAARITPSADRAEDAPRLIAAMLTAGLDRPAMRWRGAVPAASDGWAMLALADPDGRSASYGEIDAYRDRGADAGRLKARMLLAGLTGLGRLPIEDAQRLAQPLDVKFGIENGWTRAIEGAARRGEAGSVLLLLAVGMQTADWRGVPPEVLYHGCAALRAVGLEGEARMIAAEAIARL